jgi:hypothetical protein
MIIGIQRYKDNQEMWLLDSIRKVSISTDLLRRPDCEAYTDAILFDINSACTCQTEKEGCSSCVRYKRLVCRLENGSEYTIAFDTVAYIMNDEGKTFNKVVANTNQNPVNESISIKN